MAHRARRGRARRSGKGAAAAWSIAIALALAGGVAYLVWPTTTLWWIAWFAPMPLLWLVVLRERRTGQAQKDGEHFAGHDSGPWWSP